MFRQARIGRKNGFSCDSQNDRRRALQESMSRIPPIFQERGLLPSSAFLGFRHSAEPPSRRLSDQSSDSRLLFETASKCSSSSGLQPRQPATTFSAQSKYSSLRCNGHSAGSVGVISLTLQILSPSLISFAPVDKFGACSTYKRLRSCLGKLLSSVTS